MPKRLFQTLDEMNLHDTDKGTRLVEVSNSFISTRTIKAGNIVEMGIPTQAAAGIVLGTHIPILVLVDAKEYERRNKL